MCCDKWQSVLNVEKIGMQISITSKIIITQTQRTMAENEIGKVVVGLYYSHEHKATLSGAKGKNYYLLFYFLTLGTLVHLRRFKLVCDYAALRFLLIKLNKSRHNPAKINNEAILLNDPIHR